MAWQKIDSAPKDGTVIWVWLNDTGIIAMRWSSAEDAAAEDGLGGDPSEYQASWVSVDDPYDTWEPEWWQPMDAIGVPPGIVLVNGKWRPAEKWSLTRAE